MSCRKNHRFCGSKNQYDRARKWQQFLPCCAVVHYGIRIVLFALIMSLLPAGVVAKSQRFADPGPYRSFMPFITTVPMADEKSVVTEDVEMYAVEFGVSVDEALQRLALQDEAGKLQVALSSDYPKTFAGLWLEHTPEFRVVVQFTDTADDEKINAYLANPELAAITQVKTAEVSLADLEAEQAAAIAAMEGTGVPFETDIDVQGNLVEVYVTEETHLGAAGERAQMRLSPHIKVITVLALSEPAVGIYSAAKKDYSQLGLSPWNGDIYGGLTVAGPCGDKSPGDYCLCTSGFSVVSAHGIKGIVTNAHCPDELFTMNGYTSFNMPFQKGIFEGAYDVQWNVAFHRQTVRNDILISVNGTRREINQVTLGDLQPIDGWVCKYGKSSGYSCGILLSKHYKPWWVPNATPNWCVLRSESIHGDSGGPVFGGTSAYGIIQGIKDGQTIYMAIDHLDGIGVSVMTSP